MKYKYLNGNDIFLVSDTGILGKEIPSSPN